MKLTIYCIMNGLHDQCKFVKSRAMESLKNGRIDESIKYLEHARDLERIYEIIDKSHKDSGKNGTETLIDPGAFISLVRQHTKDGNFFVYSHENGMQDFKTASDARDHCELILNEMRQDAGDTGSWDEDVKSLQWGIVFGRAVDASKCVGGVTEEMEDYEMREM